MNFVLALDQGTTSSRALVFDHDGNIRAAARKELQQDFPTPGWVEHDPNEIWSSQIQVARDAIARAGLTARDIAAIGITNQRETAILWDRQTGEPLHPAIVWQDRRTAGACDALIESGYKTLFQEKTGLIPDAYFSATKLAWMLDNVPGARDKAETGRLAFGTVDTWLVWKLTDGRLHITDPSNASRTLLYDIHGGRWDAALLDIFKVPPAVLPEVRDSSAIYGETSAGHFGRCVPIGGILGDQQAALFGQMCTAPGMIKTTYGTGCFMLLNTGETPARSSHDLLTTVAWRIGGKTCYALEGSVFTGGALLQWLRDGLGLIRSADEVEALARSVSDNGDVYLVPAFTGLGAPHWDPYARGALLGITRGTTRVHLARAALEAIAFQSADLIAAMQADAGLAIAEMRVDGGASANDLLMQMQADLSRISTVRPAVIETTALGAAYCAGLALGFWDGVESLAEHWRSERRFDPEMPETEALRLRARWREAVERAKRWARP